MTVCLHPNNSAQPWAGDEQRVRSGPGGHPAQSSGFGELSTNSCCGTSTGRKDLGFWSWGMELNALPGSHRKVLGF